MSVSVIIPTIGTRTLNRAVQSVLNQTYTNILCYVVVDGVEHMDRVKIDERAHVCVLPSNVGKNNYYGHRIYAAFSHLVDTDFIMYLDEDNWMEPCHIESCVRACQDNGCDWVYSLRNIYIEGHDAMLCQDKCESLGKQPSVYGYNFVDTNSFFLRTAAAIQVCGAWHGQWGQDRVFYTAVSSAFPNFMCTGSYTINYTCKENFRVFFVLGNTMAKNETF